MSESTQRFWDFAAKLRTFALTAGAYAIGLLPLWFISASIEGDGGSPDVWVAY